MQSINLLLVVSKREEQSFLIHCQLLYILCATSGLATMSHTSTRYVFSLTQFWYLPIYLYSILFQLQSINLLLVASKRKEQSFLIHCQLLYILCTTSWLAIMSHTSTQYVFSLCQFWYLPIYLCSILFQL